MPYNPDPPWDYWDLAFFAVTLTGWVAVMGLCFWAAV